MKLQIILLLGLYVVVNYYKMDRGMNNYSNVFVKIFILGNVEMVKF